MTTGQTSGPRASDSVAPPSAPRTPIEVIALVTGAIFLILGVAGFIPGITSDWVHMRWFGRHSISDAFGLFQVSALLNALHLAFGVVGLTMSRSAAASKKYLVGAGVIYLALWVYGWIIDLHSSVNVIPLNDYDNWLHFVLGMAMLVLGLALHARAAANERSVQ